MPFQVPSCLECKRVLQQCTQPLVSQTWQQPQVGLYDNGKECSTLVAKFLLMRPQRGSFVRLMTCWHSCATRDFYCHSVGHYLGLDVHDTNTIGPHRTLEPGVVMAIEPGLYIPNHPQFGAYAGIGVRIEDDVLVTNSGAQVWDAHHHAAMTGVQQGRC